MYRKMSGQEGVGLVGLCGVILLYSREAKHAGNALVYAVQIFVSSYVAAFALRRDALS